MWRVPLSWQLRLCFGITLIDVMPQIWYFRFQWCWNLWLNELHFVCCKFCVCHLYTVMSNRDVYANTCFFWSLWTGMIGFSRFFMSDNLGYFKVDTVLKKVGRGAGLPTYGTWCTYIGVNRPAFVREVPHFGLFPAFPFLRERPAFLALFWNNKNRWKLQ